MMEKALHIMLFMWCVSFSVLGGQYIVGNVFDIELKNTWTDFSIPPDGIADETVIESHILSLIDEDEINETTENIVNANYTSNSTYYDMIETFTTAAAFVAWELVTLLSGTYIFNFLYLMGIPIYFVVVLVVIYLALLARAIIGYVRGI